MIKCAVCEQEWKTLEDTSDECPRCGNEQKNFCCPTCKQKLGKTIEELPANCFFCGVSREDIFLSFGIQIDKKLYNHADFKQFCKRYKQILDELLMLINSSKDKNIEIQKEIFRGIEREKRKIESQRMKILIVGEFSRGKSTLVNALLGKVVLPSGVSPTTATITEISNGSEAKAIIKYRDDTEKVLKLPSEKINKYLKEHITVNEKTDDIKLVELYLPGCLENLCADIIDTPGVNDLDQMREEVTYSYLENADAVILLLDAHQPLSESERIFLKEKIFGKYINKVIYVINKIDEVLYTGTEFDIPNIITYVSERLENFLSVSNPTIYAISAKNALQARHKNEEDKSPAPFEYFEKALFQFASEHATRGNFIKDRKTSLIKIISDCKFILENQCRILRMDVSELEDHLVSIQNKEESLEQKIPQLKKELEMAKGNIANSIKSYCLRQVNEWKEKLTCELNICSSRSCLEKFSYSLHRHARELALEINRYAEEEMHKEKQKIKEKFPELLTKSICTMLTSYSNDYLAHDHKSIMMIGSKEEISKNIEVQDVAIGSVVGLIGCSLFGGPIGFAAGLAGACFTNLSRRDQQVAESIQKEKNEILLRLHEKFEETEKNAGNIGRKIVEEQWINISNSMIEHAQNQISSLKISSMATEKTKKSTIDERNSMLEKVEEDLKALNSIEKKLEDLK